MRFVYNGGSFVYYLDSLRAIRAGLIEQADMGTESAGQSRPALHELIGGGSQPNEGNSLHHIVIASQQSTYQQESKHSSSLETFALSIESDSLNRDDRKISENDKKKYMPKTKSFDDLTREDKEKVSCAIIQLLSLNHDFPPL